MLAKATISAIGKSGEADSGQLALVDK